jgi:hypothetical protein
MNVLDSAAILRYILLGSPGIAALQQTSISLRMLCIYIYIRNANHKGRNEGESNIFTERKLSM